MQNLAANIKKLLDDPEVTPEELYELILLTIGESINTHRNAMERAKELRGKMMSDSFDTLLSSSPNYDSISLDNTNIDHSYHYYQHNRNK